MNSRPRDAVASAPALASTPVSDPSVDPLAECASDSRVDPVAALSSALVEIDAAHRRLRHALARDLGFSTTELTALFIVGETADLTPKQLGFEVDLSTGSVTAMIDRLEKAGYVERIAHPTDRRSLLLTLTFRGEEVMGRVSGLYEAALVGVVRESPWASEPRTVECLRQAAVAIDAAAQAQAH